MLDSGKNAPCEPIVVDAMRVVRPMVTTCRLCRDERRLARSSPFTTPSPHRPVRAVRSPCEHEYVPRLGDR
jgi:hypothetical protein